MVIDIDAERHERLKTLLDGLPPDKINDIMIKAGLIKGRSTRKSPQKAIIRTISYRTIFRSTICKHCGNVIEEALNLYKGEEFITNTDEGRCVVYRGREIKDGLKVNNYVNSCPSCPEFVSMLSRHDLETRYMNMIREYHMKTRGTITTVEGTNGKVYSHKSR